jgi:hypothetical protein
VSVERLFSVDQDAQTLPDWLGALNIGLQELL